MLKWNLFCLSTFPKADFKFSHAEFVISTCKGLNRYTEKKIIEKKKPLNKAGLCVCY